MSNVCEHGQLRRVCLTCEQIEEIKALTRECDAWRKLVMEHNETLICGCCTDFRALDIAPQSLCPSCPQLYIVDIPPELEQSP